MLTRYLELMSKEKAASKTTINVAMTPYRSMIVHELYICMHMDLTDSSYHVRQLSRKLDWCN